LSSWEKLIEDLPYPQESMASSIVGKRWLITGGYPEDKETLIFDGLHFTNGIKMPFPKEGHCQHTINSTHVFFSGGGAKGETYLLNWETRLYTILEDIPGSRYMMHTACGLLNNGNYGLEFVIAAYEHSYIFSFTDLTWRDGPTIPDFRHFVQYAPTKNGFLAIGGHDEDMFGPYLSSIYRFDEISYEWVLEQAELERGKDFFAAVAVPDDFANCL